MHRSFFIRILFFLILPALSATPVPAGNYFRYDNDVQGKIIDGDTRQPLAGVVVMALWVTEHTRITIEPEERYYDYYETLTDENGEFMIPGKGRNFFRNMPPPKIRIYKAGYGIRGINFESTGYPSNLNVTFKDDKRFVSYKKLPADKRKDSVTHYMKVPFSKMAGRPGDKCPLYDAELERDYQALGIRQWRPGEPIRVMQQAIYPATSQPVSPQKAPSPMKSWPGENPRP